PIRIARIGATEQEFANEPLAFSPHYYANASIQPAPQGEDTFSTLVSESRDFGRDRETEVVAGVRSIYRIENPARHNAQTLDCVSCHAAESARVWATRQFPWLSLELEGAPFRFRSRFDLNNTSPLVGNTQVLRAFGYGGN